MKIIRKLLIVFLIVTILAPFFPQKIFADDEFDPWSDTYQESPPDGGGFDIKGLTIAQRTYFSIYVRVYLREHENLGEPLVIYDRSSYSTVAYQNEWPADMVLKSGTAVPSQRSYSRKIPTSCAWFTAGMLHQALGIDFDRYMVGGHDNCRRQ